eukprot:jgi/Tetstr1/427644/TSEL_017769.t1
MFIAIKLARFYLREIFDVLRTKDSWSGRVKMALSGDNVNETTEAHGLRYDGDRELHITHKDLTAARYAVLAFLLKLRGREAMLHKDNMGVVCTLANLTSRSPLLMTETQKLWFILDTNDISIRARYMKATAYILDDCLSCEIEYDDWAFNLRHFNHLDKTSGCHTSTASLLHWRTRVSRVTTPAARPLQ